MFQKFGLLALICGILLSCTACGITVGESPDSEASSAYAASSETTLTIPQENPLVGIWTNLGDGSGADPVWTITFNEDGTYKEKFQNPANTFTYTGTYGLEDNILTRIRGEGQLSSGKSTLKIKLEDDCFYLYKSDGDIEVFLKK